MVCVFISMWRIFNQELHDEDEETGWRQEEMRE
jgi:hypothetical protein